MRLSISLISKAFAPDSIFGRDRPRFNADAAAAPLRQMLPVCCRTERVTRIDLSTSEIEFDDGSGTLTRLHYDHVVIACVAESNLGIIPGMSDHAFASFKLHDRKTGATVWSSNYMRMTSP